MMRDYDLTPLWRSTVGFDRVFDLLDNSVRWTGEDNYPPYNIQRIDDDHYQITLALAGFSTDEVHRCNRKKAQPYEIPDYPLIDLRMSRGDCQQLIADAGLPVPPRSAGSSAS